MERKAASGMMLTLLIVSMGTLGFQIRLAKASGPIYIRSFGAVDPPTAPLSTLDNVTYTFAGDINDSIIVQRKNIIIDGNGYALNGPGSLYFHGITVESYGGMIATNVTIQHMNITGWSVYAIALINTDSNRILESNLANNRNGIWLKESLNNVISGNNITENTFNSIVLDQSSNNTVSRNNMGNSGYGVRLRYSSNNTVFGNNIANNDYFGIALPDSSDNKLHHNNFIDNVEQVNTEYIGNNIWDDGYPSGGNYWSDYTIRYPDAQELDESGTWDTPYVIDENNQDNYPLMKPWTPAPPVPTTIDELKTKVEELGSQGEIDNQGIVKSLIAKLNTAQKLIDKEKVDEARSIFEGDFIPQVQNLSGVHITMEAADILIQSAEYLLSHL